MTNEILIAGNLAMPDTSGNTMTGNSGPGVAKISWSGTGCTSAIVPVTVSVGIAPIVSGGANQQICEGNPTTLSGSGADTYQWNNNVQDGVPFTPTTTQTYDVIGTAANGCSDTAQVTVTVNPVPTVNLGPDTMICDYNLPYTLNATASAGAIFNWNTGATNSSIQVTAPGIYSVIATNGFECSATDTINIEVSGCAGLDEETSTLLVYPNPFTEQVIISSSETINAQVMVLSMEGKIVANVRMEGQSLEIPLSGLARGAYMVKIMQGDRIQITNLVKQ